MKLRKLSLAIGMLVMSVSGANAATYLISGSATTAGATISHEGIEYVVGTTAFADFATFAAANPTANSTVYVAAGTYSTPATIKTSGLTFIGNNAYCDYSATRAAESNITAQINIEASNVTMNGFHLTGNGRFVSTSGTNATPLSGIKYIYNYVSSSTIARSWSLPILQLGSRVTNADMNSTTSQCRYKNCEVSHNYFVGDASHYPTGIGLAGIFGTTTIYDNRIVDGGTSLLIDNAQGTINVLGNKFLNVGKSTAAAPDGGKKGDFCVALYYSAYANTTTLNVKNNEFNGCYGQESSFSLIRVYPGSSTGNYVSPKNLSVNINANIFRNKTSGASNTSFLNENYVMYADKGTTSSVKFDLADNHFDNRFYKFGWVTLADGLGQREVYSNAYDQFTFGGTYSTMGTSIIDGVDISNHAKNVKTGAVTVLQSMDIDMKTGDMYFLQLMGNSAANSFCSKHGLSSTNCDPLVITRVKCTKKATATSGTFTYSTTIEKMNIAKSGHGVKLSCVRDKNGELWLITGGKGSDNGSGNDLSGTSIARFKFQAGKDLILDGSGKTDGSVVYFKHPAGKSNAYGAVDEMNRYLCVSSSGNGYQYYIYDLDEYLEGNSSPRFIKSVAIKSGDDPISGSGASGDTGFIKWSYQSYCINGDYIYTLEGVATTVSGHAIIISTYNWRTGQFLKRTHVNYSRINNTFGEPEALTIRPDVFGNVSCYLGTAAGASGSRTQNVFKYHIDRHLNSAGTVIGDDTSTGAQHFNTAQYSGITMATSANSYSLTSASTSDTPSQSITISRSSKYLYGGWSGAITGADGKVFSVDISSHDQYSSSFTAKVTFKPDGLKKNYSANLRLSSPGASDIIIPINATYTGSINGGGGSDPGTDPNSPTISSNNMNVNLNGEVGATNAPYVDIKITAANLTADMTVNSNSGSVTASTLSDWNPRTGGTLRLTLNTNFSLGAGTYDSFVAVQSGSSTTPEARLEIPFTVTLTEGTSNPDPGEPDPEEPVMNDKISSLNEIWNYSQISGKTANWITNGSQVTQDMTFKDGKLYVVHRNGSNSDNKIYIVDAYTGTKLGELPTSTCTSGTYALSSIENFGGKIIAASLAASGTEALKIYMWDNDTSEPTVLLNTTEHNGVRAGDALSVSGNLTNGKIWFGFGSSIYYYTVENGTVKSTTPTVVALTKNGAAYEANEHSAQNITVEPDNTLWVSAKDYKSAHFTETGEFLEELPLSTVHGTDVAIINLGSQSYAAGMTYLNKTAGTSYLSEGLFTLMNITGGITDAVTIGNYPEAGLGTSRNTSFRNTICYEITDKHLNIWVLVPFQGAAMYQYEHTSESSVTPDPEDPDPNPGPGTSTMNDNITSLTEEWNYSQNSGNTISWITNGSQNAEDMALKDGKLYVVNYTDGKVYIVDAYTGAKHGELNMEGCSGGAHAISSIENLGGKIIVSNLVTGASDELKIYSWDSDTAKPSVLLTTTSHNGVRAGDAMGVNGDMSNGKIWFASPASASVYYYTINNGVCSTTPTVINLTKNGAAYTAIAHGAANITVESDGSFWVDAQNLTAAHFSASGAYIEEVSNAHNYGTDYKPFTLGSKKYAAAMTYANKTNTLTEGSLQLLNVTDGIASASIIGTYPSAGLGSARNTSFRNTLCYEVGSEKLYIWVLVPNQGAACYSFKHTTYSGVEDLFATPEVTLPVEWYNLQGARVDGDNLVPGIYIRRQGTDVKKVLVK